MPPDLDEITERARNAVSSRAELPGMSLLEHLEELRRRLILSALGVVAAFFACWHYSEWLYQKMQAPITHALQSHHLDDKLVYTNPTEPFNMYLKVALLAGVFAACPWILYQVWMFISPGLYRNEKRYAIPFLVATVSLFVSGGVFGYTMVYPAALDFLLTQGSQFKPMITITEYTDLFLTVMLGLGVVFELPILVFFLSFMGVISAGWMWRNLRYSILAIFTIAAVITPTTDILNMCIFAAPMVALYLISIGVAWLVHPKRRRKRAEGG
jgi:sec-independent protein translocase protein TatC